MGDIVTPGAISKGAIHQRVDAVVNERSGGHFTKRAAFLEGLRRATTSEAYLTLLHDQAGSSNDEVNYLRLKFYPNPNAWRADGRVVYAIMRAGLLKALDECGSTLPLDSYWLIAPGMKKAETIVTKSQNQVTRIFVTPPIPMRNGGPRRTVDADMWVVAPQAKATEKKGFASRDAVVQSVQGKVVTWRRREFAGAGPSPQ
jgi:hypothetical protein